ncbi:MAG: 1-acyl-sn-glycerol-3-phosphate acyltransferase [Anaerolineae bacterium]|nr:1-acyl-sn-glycerol-3-phosphate acyltransferase [Gemmatimonadaceae bacterium]
MRTILAYLSLAVLTFSVALFVVIATTLGFKVTPNGLLERQAGFFSRWVMRAAGARILVNNPERIVPGEPRIYVANHVSWFDVFALASIIPRFRFIAKKELQRIPVWGRAVSKVAAIYIDRQNRKAAFDAYNEAAAQVRTGISVVVCPEGTRGRTYELRPFKKGPFVLAIAAQAPVVPCIVYGTREIQPKGAIRIRPGLVEITLLEPVPTAGLTYEDRDTLMQTVWDSMAAELERRHGIHSTGAAIDTRPTSA